MAYFNIKFFSNELRRTVSFDMIIPNDFRNDISAEENIHRKRKMKTLFMLHGYTGAAECWIPHYLCEEYNFAAVMPNGENSFYLDGLSTGHSYCSFVGRELTDYIRKTFGLAMNSDETYIMGFSMGGFGALHTALAYPERFGKTGAMSSALIVHEVAKMRNGEGNGVANYEYYRECFGEPDKLLEGSNNPEKLILDLKNSGAGIPEIYLCCGTEDFLIENNRQFHEFLENNGIAHRYEESKGVHDMRFWSEYSEKIIKWMFD